MIISPPLTKATFLKRYKRFLVDVRLENGELLTIHCPNTGSMKHCQEPETPCWFSLSNNPKRKLPGTLEIVTTSLGFLAGVNTGRPNQLVKEAILEGKVPELAGYEDLKSEVRYGEENSRIDLLLESPAGKCFIEVKNVTLEDKQGLLLFPDAVTSRGTKHLRELMTMVNRGHRAVLFFCVQHSGVERVAAAGHIDSLYAKTLKEALAAGVEVLAYKCKLTPEEIRLDHSIAFVPEL